MRVIKFRAWDIQGKHMYYNAEHAYDFKNGCPADSFGKMLDDKSEWNMMQFTSLKDKNGKEIYEGDVITEGYNEKYGRRIIKYENGAFNLFEGGDNSWEVIGNIYENPEFLK